MKIDFLGYVFGTDITAFQDKHKFILSTETALEFANLLIAESEKKGFKIGCKYSFDTSKDQVYIFEKDKIVSFDYFRDGTWNLCIDTLAIWRSDSGWVATPQS